MKKSLFKFLFFMSLLISGCATVPQPIPQSQMKPDGVYHLVGSGETLWRIAKTYCVDIRQIMAANNISNPTQIGVGQELFIPRAKTVLPIAPRQQITQEGIRKLVGPKYRSCKWRFITLHHSATLEGNAGSFDRNHRRRRMGGLFYHFVIGNGAGSGNGEVEVGWRWRKQDQVNRPFDIQICLVGNFDRQRVTEAQFSSLVGLINILCKQYNIPLNNIRRHQDINGKPTECPGDNFPFSKLLTELRRSG